MGVVSVMGVMMAESSGILDRQGGKPNQHQPLLLAKRAHYELRPALTKEMLYHPFCRER